MRRVLVVDDDRSIVRMMRLTLRTSGFDVETAHDGAEALQKIVDKHPDVIVLDLQMPVMDGESLLRELRVRGIDTPVVVVSGAHWRYDCHAHGADAYLPKPFPPDVLIKTVESFAIARATEAPLDSATDAAAAG